jgi:glucose/mannose-6-phosphate isomerase
MLNDINKIKQIDKSNMLNLIFELPENCEEAVKIAYKCIKGHRYHNIFNVVVTGMGGSAIGGDLIRMLTLNEVNVPITINRDYSLPQFVDDKTLVVASSYSGAPCEATGYCPEGKFSCGRYTVR